MQNNDPRKSIHNGLMYLNKILETSPYLQIHQFLVDSYLACTQIGQHVQTFFNFNGSTDNIKKQILKVYEEFLKWEVEIKETADRNHQQRTVNAVVTQASLQGNPIAQGTIWVMGSQGGQIVQGSAGTTGILGVQTVQAVDPYAILGIRSLEQAGSVTDWDDAFENKLILLLGQFELGLTEGDEIFELAEESDDESDDEELFV
ncbi:hypothetical protein F5882DRAFT_417927 [Hyaloscypha sp. PMI_1271]|nr:hypothetical protein F5882DRAFT_417927 [Hyaloscypha sp. PMI_1271]